jgi:hypothetical protein
MQQPLLSDGLRRQWQSSDHVVIPTEEQCSALSLQRCYKQVIWSSKLVLGLSMETENIVRISH